MNTLQFFSVPKCFFFYREETFKGQKTLRNVDQSLYFEFENSAKSYAIQLHFVVDRRYYHLSIV